MADGFYNWLVQCAHRVAPASIAILQNGQFFVAGAAAGRMNALLIRHATNPTIRKFTSALPKSPILNGIGPGVTVDCHDLGSGVATATIGMMKSSTSAATSLFSAPPTTTAIANASTFSFTRNVLNSFHIGIGASRSHAQ